MSLAATWTETFGIAHRVGTPDLALDVETVVGFPHAAAMRVGFECKVDGFFSISGVPTIAFLIRDHLDRDEINEVHQALWNQGLASLLVLQLQNVVHIYSLWQKPVPPGWDEPAERDMRLVETLDLASQAFGIRNLVPEVESGQYFGQHRDRFDRHSRIDEALLRNLKITRDRLIGRRVEPNAARALILQIIFIAYLEDRGIIDSEDFQAAAGTDFKSLLEVLSAREAQILESLFGYLSRTFNGDVFHAPGQFQVSGDDVTLEPVQMEPLAELRDGTLEMGTGQIRFWPYNFRFIPVELISAIYDRFLNEDDLGRAENGAYFTPRFLADLVVDQVWDTLDVEARGSHFRVLDPACGSAIFLVRMFQKIVEEHRRSHHGEAPDWPTLRGFVDRLHGWDIQESAVRIGVFSLYVALLEQVHPPAIRALKAAGRILPPLLGTTLHPRDFFAEEDAEPHFDVIVGNPPWVSRRSEQVKTALLWCKKHGRPAPGDEIAWAFLWKAAEHLSPNGRVALLLPAMGILLNHNNKVNEARQRWLEGIEVTRIINFADVCFQLFDDADRPTILALYRLNARPGRDYEIEYWVPKAHRLLSATRLLLISSVDQSRIRMSAARRDPAVWKKRMWATTRDLKLLQWLGDLPKLGAILTTYGRAQRRKVLPGKWIIGQGFKPYNPESTSKHHTRDVEEAVTRHPFLEASQFRPWILPSITAAPWPTTTVHRKGFPDGYLGPHILVPQGVIRTEGLVRAAYVEQSLCFRHSLQAIRFPEGQEKRAKLLTAVLNSPLAAWYYFHTSANFGADRAKVHEEQLLELPFPPVDQVPDSIAAERAEASIVEIFDSLLARKDEFLAPSNWIEPYAQAANRLVYEFYGLTAEERLLVEDGLHAIIPSMQPRKDVVTPLMQESSAESRLEYTRQLIAALHEWMRPEVELSARIIEGRSDTAVIELRLDSNGGGVRVDRQIAELERALDRIMAQLPATVSHNLELQPDLRVFLGDSLYLAKPLSTRYWLASAALNDADEIAGDLLSAETRIGREAGHERHR
jgi:type I restriction-modification system DNA methylase subunit